MLSKNCRVILFIFLLIYILLLLIFTKVFIFNGRCCFQEKPILEFTIKVKKDDGLLHNELFISGSYNRGMKENAHPNDVFFMSNQHITSSKDKSEVKTTNLENDDVNKRLEKQTDKSKTNKNINNIIDSSKSQQKKKYLFSLRYYEQLTRGTKNLLSLASLGAYFNRHIVMPYVNNSRFSGLQSGASMSRFMELKSNHSNLEKGIKFSNLSTYFDVEDLNDKLRNNGYSSLVSFQEFRSNCKEIDVVVHFLYEKSDKDLEKWYKLTPEKLKEVRHNVKHNGGYSECKFVKHSRINTFLAANVKKFVCVDPEIIKSAEDLERKVFKNQQCIAVVMWKGDGLKRAHFTLAPSIKKELQPSNLKFNDKLKDIAYSYIRDVINRPFISVHVRIERHLVRAGLLIAKKCLKKLSSVVLQRSSSFHLKKIFLASDLGEHGSDTLQSNSNLTDRLSLQTELLKGLEKPYTFNPKDYGLYDRGQIAIVEMHILSLGESLFTLGRGNFQDWIMDMFLFHNAEDRSLIYRICELKK